MRSLLLKDIKQLAQGLFAYKKVAFESWSVKLFSFSEILFKNQAESKQPSCHFMQSIYFCIVEDISVSFLLEFITKVQFLLLSSCSTN